jgi:hypothetical protein
MQRSMILGVLVLSGVAVAGAGAAGQVVTDVRKSCQITVPADWSVKTSTAYGPGQAVSASVHGLRAGQTFEAGKTMTETMYKPIKVLRDDAKRLVYSMDPGAVAPGRHGWYVVANTTPVCTVAFTFDGDGNPALMNEIADSLGPAAK